MIPVSGSVSHSPPQTIRRDSLSLPSLSNSLTGKSLLPAPDLLFGSKVEASISAASGNSLNGETPVRTTANRSASQSLENIIRKSSNASLATKSTSVDKSAGTADQETTEGPSTIERDLAATRTDNTASLQVAPPFIGTVLEGHAFTPIPTSPAESVSPPVENTPTSHPTTTPEKDAGFSGNSAIDKRSSLSVFATWWSGGNFTTLNSTNLNTASGHGKTYTQERGYAPTISPAVVTPSPSLVATPASPSLVATPASPSATISETTTYDGMEWEPSGLEAALVQKALIQKDKFIHPSLPSSLSSSPPLSATFPASMIKHHSKLAAPAGERRGSTSSTQASLTSMLWSRLAASQDNVVHTEAPSDAKDKMTDQIIPVATSQESISTDMDIDQVTRDRHAITRVHAKGTDSPANSGKKRWSLFSYGAKDEDEDDESSPAAKLRKSGDVHIEQESRPVSVKGTVNSTTMQEPPNDTASARSLSESTPPASTTVKTEIVEPSDEGGPVAPALVETSGLDVGVLPGATVFKDKKDSGPTSSGTLSSSTYSWLSIIPGLGTKTEDANSAANQLRVSDQVTDYEEGERKDVNGNTIKLSEKPDVQRIAEMIEAKNVKETLVSKEELKKGLKDGQTFAQLKERYDHEAIIAKEADKAVSSLSKVIFKKKNVVLPGYYEQYPDVRRSLISLPLDPVDIPIQESKHEQSSSIMKSAVNALSSLLFSKQTPEQPAPPIEDDPIHQGTKGLKKVAIIGVHGWFPVKLIRTVIGEPTGTSKKFCDEMDLALKDYLKIHNVELGDDDITLIPLEGEGKVMNRVELLYQNLVKNETWKNALHEADLVLVATHSQGTPTSTLLMARLINEGMLRVREDDPKMQRMGILAMAGISHGPFPSLKGNLIVRWFEAEAAQELFKFMDSEMEIAQKYREALRTVLVSGVRFTLVASMEDQVVPLHSAVMTSIHHPSIVRAVYIDGTSYQDDFLTNLISFSLRLRNSGVDDHGVLVQLSEVVAGSIYGEGHSTIYEEREVYMLAIRALLEPPESLTSEMARSEPILHPFHAKQNLNPFYLPWGMRGIMDDIKALDDEVLNEEMERLKKLYDEWNPVNKGMKEIKFRLEPVRSRL